MTIRDQWDRTVTAPKAPKRVVVIEWEGLVAKTMQILGVAETLVGVDKATKEQTHRNALIPAVGRAENVGTAFAGLNYERIAGLRPDVIIFEAWAATQKNRDLHNDIVKKLEGLGIPVIVLLSPSNYEQPRLSTAWEIVTLVGDLFGKRAETDRIVKRLEEGVTRVRDRTEPLKGQAPKVAIFATINNVMGRRSIQSYMLTDVVNARNPVDKGTFVTVSEEQLLALDPDALLVIGHEGWLDPAHIYAGRHAGVNWGALGSMRAIRNRRVAALGYDEWRATIETPVALLKMAKLAYPDAFADIDIDREELAFYRDVYRLDETAARRLIEGQKFVGAVEVK